MEKVLIIGASGLAREVLALAHSGSSQVVFGVLDDGWADMADSFAGVPLLGSIERAIEYIDIKLLVCVGSGEARERIVERLALLGVGPGAYTTAIDPSVSNHGNCFIGPGSIVLANTVLTASVTVGSHVVLMPNVTLTHDDVVDDFATVAAGAAVGGGVEIGRGAYIGMNASIRQKLRVGARSVLGMGAVLLESLPDGETWAGVPARRISDSVIEDTPPPPTTTASPTVEGAP
ncbi:MAG: NeuD/PglB/VioB family sugar acetyltransferase [Mycetocola sp.]